METDPEDVWMVLKSSWIPLPSWLSAEAAGRQSSAVQAPKPRAPAQHARRMEPTRIAPVNNELPSLSIKEAPYPPKLKRKAPRALQAKSAERVEYARSIKLVPETIYNDPAFGRCGRVSETSSTPKTPDRQRNIIKSNVVELRPRRDEMYASQILDALCKACEAHDAGEDELLMERIKSLYHMFDEIAR